MLVIIVGGGIAGLTSAISLRRVGHEVHIYERSAFSNEVGAAINISANASRGLLALGMEPVRAKFVTAESLLRAKGDTLEQIHLVKFEPPMEVAYGAPWFLAHRADLHEELKRLATCDKDAGTPVVIHLRSTVNTYVSSTTCNFTPKPVAMGRGLEEVETEVVTGPRHCFYHIGRWYHRLR